VDVVSKGYKLLLTVGWWTHSQQGITIRHEGGGAYHAIIGTLLQALVCAGISVPIGIMTAVYLVEYGRGRFARLVSFMVDILTGVPSIVAALFIYAVWVTTFGLDRVGFAVSLALVLLMIPVIVRSTEEMLKLVPNELREASYALGVPTWKTIMRIVLPTAFTGHRHRRPARPGARDGRDGAAADPRPLRQVDQHESVQRIPGGSAYHDLSGPHRVARTRRRPHLGGGPDADHRRSRAEPRRPAHRPAIPGSWLTPGRRPATTPRPPATPQQTGRHARWHSGSTSRTSTSTTARSRPSRTSP
jgi:hypothetical protein